MCRRKWMSLIAVFVLTGSLLSGCGSKESSQEAYVSEESYATDDMYMEDVATTEAMEPSTAVEKTAENGDAAVTAETGTAPSVSENRKLIKNVYFNCKNFTPSVFIQLLFFYNNVIPSELDSTFKFVVIRIAFHHNY